MTFFKCAICTMFHETGFTTIRQHDATKGRHVPWVWTRDTLPPGAEINDRENGKNERTARGGIRATTP
jgi:hypothetical protein